MLFLKSLFTLHSKRNSKWIFAIFSHCEITSGIKGKFNFTFIELIFNRSDFDWIQGQFEKIYLNLRSIEENQTEYWIIHNISNSRLKWIQVNSRSIKKNSSHFISRWILVTWVIYWKVSSGFQKVNKYFLATFFRTFFIFLKIGRVNNK